MIPNPSDILEAPLSSYINQECDTDVKYSFSGSHKSIIPKIVKDFCKKYIKKFESGYFATKKIISNSSKIDLNVTKFCLEPNKLTMSEASSLAHFNKTSLSSLHNERRPNKNSTVAGLTIAVDSQTLSIVAVFFAIRSSNIGYQNVYYKRWNGESVADVL